MFQMMSSYNQNFKMIVLKIQLLVVFYLINGRYAYKEYDNYDHGTRSNFSQINSNEPPGKHNFTTANKYSECVHVARNI